MTSYHTGAGYNPALKYRREHDCCGGLNNVDYSKMDLKVFEEVFKQINFHDSNFHIAVIAIIFNPLFWNVHDCGDEDPSQVGVVGQARSVLLWCIFHRIGFSAGGQQLSSSWIHRNIPWFLYELQLVRNSCLNHSRKPLIHHIMQKPCRLRMNCKILLCNFKAINVITPRYLSDLLQHTSLDCPLASSLLCLLPATAPQSF
ncbi:phosphatidylethanolamine N-methyltransferase isoform X4 [Nerophis ophidion]|uniref:phosphatidylethanolamine N-methyltransferase isoform X4 n=1 Tax=Nerophis ophidion TaxID=159077 RepID=UPI002ADF28A0|nr:phosphatidylethanolamine N-methyltransferase isoform X4 [Nerophis ophidion]